MLERFITILYLELIHLIITSDPAKSTASHKAGNEFSNFKVRIINLIASFLCFVYHITCYNGYALTTFEYFLISLVTFGACLRLWAFVELGRFFTFTIGIQENHQIISSGPYMLFSHPGYIGQFFVVMGIVVFCDLPWFVFIPIIFYLFYRFYHRITEEEKMLIEHFGDKYTNYKKSVFII